MVSYLKDIVSEVTLAFFGEHILPPSPLLNEASLKWVVGRLREQDSEEIPKSNRWMKWPQLSNSDANEDNIFAKFQHLTEDVITAAASQINKAVNVKFKCSPHTTLESSTRDNTSRPDCFGILPTRAHNRDNATGSWRPGWLDIATPGEFKKDNTIGDFVDDVKKVLWSMNHVMREDPRRSSVIGFTVEDSSMRLWFCSRSDVFMSEAFDISTNLELFVDFILRMSYATEQQLGWDSSITLHEESLLSPGGLQYDIQVVERDESEPKAIISDRTFRTQRIMSNYGADGLRGSGTRVWEVKEINERGEIVGESCVLKDSWIDTERRNEGSILAEIRREALALRRRKELDLAVKEEARVAALKAAKEVAMQAVGSTGVSTEVLVEALGKTSVGEGAAAPESAADAASQKTDATPEEEAVAADVMSQKTDARREVDGIEQYLVTVVTYGSVWIDGTEVQTRGWKTQPEYTGILAVGSKPPTKTEVGVQPIGASTHEVETEQDQKPTQITTFAGKAHHRIVFREICETIDSVTSLAKFFQYLGQISSALKYLHELKWVHRDISPGNILIFNGFPKLADLEYAKHESDWKVCGVRTGTPYFMAVEVDRNRYSHLTDPPILPLKWVPAESTRRFLQIPKAKNPIVPFRNNPLHDQESLLWLALHHVLSGRLVSVGGVAHPLLEEDTKNHRKLVNALFNEKDTRGCCIITEEEFGSQISQATLHETIAGILHHLKPLFIELRKAYHSAESERLTPIPFTVADGLHDQFKEVFCAISGALMWEDVTVAADLASYNRLRKLYCSASVTVGKESRRDGDDDEDTAEPSARPTKKQRTKETSSTLPKTTSASHHRYKRRC